MYIDLSSVLGYEKKKENLILSLFCAKKKAIKNAVYLLEA